MAGNSSAVCPLVRRHRTSFLIFVIFVAAFSIPMSADAQNNKYGDYAYAKKAEDNLEFFKNPKLSNLSSADVKDSTMVKSIKSVDDHRSRQSSKAAEKSPALEKFLRDVLKAQNDLRWIDQVLGTSRDKDWGNKRHGNKLRAKRSFDRNYGSIWRTNRNKYRDDNIFQVPRRASFDDDMMFKRDVDFEDVDTFPNRFHKNEMFYDKGPGNDQIPKEWIKTKDLCSLSDWLNSDKNPEIELDKSGDQWIQYQSGQKNMPNSLDLDKEASLKTDARLNVRNQRDETKKAATPSLESLKETILELKKNLNEADRKRRVNFKSTDSSKVSEKGNDNQEERERKTRTKDNHKKNEDDGVLTQASSDLRGGDRDAERFDLRKREQVSKELEDKNAHPKVRRTKRTKANKDDGNPKLFHRAGFGASYLEESALKELHDRRRRSKGTPTDEKRHADEDGSNSGADEKNPITILKANDDSDATISEKKELNNLQEANSFEQASKPTGDREDAANSRTSNAEKTDCQKPETAKNNVQLDVSRENLNAMENRLMRNEEKGESLRGNSLRTFESVTNELQPVSPPNEISSLGADRREESSKETRMQKTEENRENVGLAKGEQVIKVFEPQGRLYQNSERTKEVRGTEPENEQGILSQRPTEDKRSPNDSGNMNILVKSENRNVIKFSNDCTNDKSGNRPSSCMLNVFDMKKKMILEHDDNPSKTISTLFDVKYEKAQIDEPVKSTNKREENLGNDDVPFGNGVFDFERSKDKEVPYEDTPASTNDVKQRNADEKRLENSAELNKGSEQSGVNDKGSQNWFENAIRNQMDMTVDQGAAEKPNEIGEKEKPTSEEERLGDYKENADSNNKIELKEAKDEPQTKKRYHEIFIVPSGMDDRIISDKYSQRRILQYMEYSNDDVEDVDINYNNKEEDGQQQVNEGLDKNDVSVRRKERSSVDSDTKSRGKVNIMIQDKLQKKKNPSRNRKRRNPSVIEYYDYDSDMEQEALSPTSEQERIKNNYQDKNVNSDAGLVEYEKSGQTCPPTAPKSNEQEEAMKKEEELKAKYKMPKEQFLSPAAEMHESKNKTGKSGSGSSLASMSSMTSVKYTDEEESTGNQQPGSRLDEPIEVNEDKFLDSDSKYIVLNPAKYILKEEKGLDPSGIDDFLEDVQSVDEKKEKIPSSMEPWYEELKKIYDWSEDETKVKPRIKGDQRMYYGADDKLESNDRTPEPLKDLAELPTSHRETGRPEIAERNNPVAAASSGRYENAATSNVSHSNYFALKSTDDMFKGGSEQSNSTGEKLRGPSAIGTAAEWQTQKVNGVRNGAAPEKDAAGWSLTNRGQYIDTDSRSPYENRKYLESQFPRSREHVQNIDSEKQILISSGDLHESFVEPVEWIDDFDRDIRVRLSRSLKTIETSSAAYAESNTIRQDKNVINSSIDTVCNATSKSEESKVDVATQTSAGVQQLLKNDVRVKRDAAFRYNAFYDDVNQRNRDLQNMDYTRYLRNNKMNNNPRFSDSYEDMGQLSNNQKLYYSNQLPDDYYLDDADDDYEKVARSPVPKKKKHDKKKVQKKKRKGHTRESSKSRRKRRHHKKHSNDSKTKNHEKKHKKNASKSTSHHTNVKKSKAGSSEEKAHKERKAHHEKVKKKDTSVDRDSQRRGISSLLIADNVEDESQMDSALHGELAGRIVEHIFDQVQKNDALKVSLGPGLYQKHKTRDTVEAERSFSQSMANDEIKHTEELLNKIMLLLNRLIFDEVQRKTCISLPPDLLEFLDWMLDVNPQERSMGQPPTLPLISAGVSQTIPQDKFLFQSYPVQEMEAEVNELYVKIQTIQKLIKEYSTLEEKDKAKVESIQDYLAKQLDLLLEYIESKEEAEKKGESPSPNGEPKVNGGSVLQDQVGMSNTSNGNYSTNPDTFSTLMNVPNILKLNNGHLLTAEGLFQENGIDAPHRGPRIIRSLDKHTKRNKKRRKRKKRKRKHGKHHKDATIGQSPYKDTVQKPVGQRQKREYLDNLFWDSSGSGYEEPLIYNFIDVTNVASNENDDTALKKLKEGAVDKGNKDVQPLKENVANDLKKDESGTEGDGSKSLTKTQSQERININEDENAFREEESITGKNRLEDEILLLNKRQAWRKENEQELEEVAFGEDMRKATADKVLFEKLTKIDKEKSELNATRTQNCTLRDYAINNRNNSCSLSDEDKLRMLEEKINVYADK